MRALLLALAAAAVMATPAWAVPAVSGEFPVSSVDSNNKLTQGPDGNMWVTLNEAGKDVARMTPAGEVTEYDLEAITASGIATDAEGNLWITRNGGVTKFSPANPEGTKAATAIAAITTFHSIVLGPDGNLWVATVDNLVRIPPADPASFKAFPIAELSPRDIDVAGPQLVVADFGGRVLTATTADPPVTVDYKLSGGSQGVAGAPSGQIAFSQQGNAPTEFGLLTPPGPPLLTPSPGTDPFGVAFGTDGAFWVAQFATDSLTRLGTDNVATPLSGFAAASGPRQIAAGPGNTLWVTLETAKKIGRISGVDPEAPPTPSPTPAPTPVAPEPRTQIKAGPKKKVKTRARKAKVRFRFRSPDAGATFQCRLRQLPKRKAAKAFKSPKFKVCKSPRAYRLGPGRYRFEVRAVLNGVADETPAKRGFRVIRLAKKR
jgi:streptogramin lyase